ncbi:uncharacterized protein LOC131235550 isoform X10 [Magnolia sinica]|uniref:uncharacterized protein LOC131235550 isoform X10 n=1 Tax=Magnolia sinica TaxID=86752 RepID=UPI002657EF4B|nr:uncharacterized protein LOC131235550 isoform X10 [Magnolia sinica]
MSRLEAKRLRKAVIPSSLPLVDPSPANLQSTRLSPHVNRDESSCSVYIASGCSVYRVEISMEDSIVTKGKESLLIPVHAQVSDSSLVNRCPHRAEIQSVALVEMDCDSGVILGTVDSFGHLIVSRIDGSGQDIDLPTYSVLPRDCGVGEGSWAGICFSPSHWSMTAVARSFCKSIDIYDQDIHLQSFHTLLYPSSLCFLRSSLSGDDSSILAVAEGSQAPGNLVSALPIIKTRILMICMTREFVDQLETFFMRFAVLQLGILQLVDLIVLYPYMTLADGQPCHVG